MPPGPRKKKQTIPVGSGELRSWFKWDAYLRKLHRLFLHFSSFAFFIIFFKLPNRPIKQMKKVFTPISLSCTTPPRYASKSGIQN